MGGWIRIGIVLSVIWGVGGTLWGRSMILDGVQSRTSLQVDACVSRNKALLHSRGDNSEPYDKIWTPCWAELGKNYVANLEAVQPYWWNAAIFGLAPIPIVWLIIYGIVGIGRWIRRGFSSAAT